MERRVLVLLMVLAGAGCDNTISGPSGTAASSSSTTASVTPTSEFFEATLAPGGSTFYSFTESTAGSVAVTLASVVPPGLTGALSTPIKVGLGTPVGEGCTVTDSVDMAPALVPQFTVSMAAGVHCLWVGDAGQLTSTVIASVRFTHH